MRPSTRRLARALLRPLLTARPLPVLSAARTHPLAAAAVAVHRVATTPRRTLHATPPLSAPAPLEVRLPPLGESISEGAIATLHVKPGDVVAEDAVLASVETDKVTVDVRAPSAGVVTSVLVSEGDSVVVGQLVVVLQQGEEGAVVVEPAVPTAAQPAEAAAAPPPPPPPPPSFASAPAVATSTTHHRRPSIRFPRRVTTAGARISSLPASAQAAARDLDDGENLLARLSAGRGGLYIGRERGTKLSRSRVLTDAEIEQIELGGAV